MTAADDDRDMTVTARWYADMFRVGHNAFEFKLDCGRDAGDAMTAVYLRVLTSPHRARELFRLLGVALIQYADAFGPIGEPGAAPRLPRRVGRQA